MNMTDMLRTMQDSWRRIRSQYHLTLGDLIEFLSSQEGHMIVRVDACVEDDAVYPGMPDSYRGYYDDLAFAPTGEPITCDELLKRCKLALNSTYQGYKGGDFVMSEDTPLWLSAYGINSQIAIVAVEHVGDSLVLKTKQIED